MIESIMGKIARDTKLGVFDKEGTNQHIALQRNLLW